MDKKKKDEVDYAAVYRQFLYFDHGRSLKQLCDNEDYDNGKLQHYSRYAKYIVLNVLMHSLLHS